MSGADLGIGPQAGRGWTARMRLHQSWWRSERLGVPYGPGSGRASGNLYGNMLTRADGERGLNFVSDAAWAAYRSHPGRGVEPDRCERNLLSSQPLAFNLFGPLTVDSALATRLLRPLVEDLDEVTGVHIEVPPQPKVEYLNDSTSFDALVTYLTTDGTRAFAGVEAKLTEPFTRRDFGIKPAYREITEAGGSPWRPGVIEECHDRRWRQLWRDHLLVEACAGHPERPYGERGRVVVVRHPGDPEIGPVMTGYQRLLTHPETCVDLPLDRLLSSWRVHARSGTEQDWLQRLHDRYLDLALSEHLVVRS